jgi:hypothetical protein
LAALLSVSLLIGASCGPTSFNVKELKLDSGLHLIPIGHRTLRDPSEGTYYFIFHAARGLTSVDHFDARPNGRERLLYLESDSNQVLDRTVKTEEMLKGAYGTIYATKTCFYASPLARGYSSVSVGAGDNEIGNEISTELPSAPEALPPLTSVSLIRIFRTAPEYVVAGANYEPDGRLGGLDISGAKGGDRDPGFGEGAFVFPGPTREPAELAKRYGIPARLDVRDYLSSGRPRFPAVAFSQEVAVIDLYYGYDKIIRQDTLKDGAVSSSRFLQPSLTL